MIDTDHLVKNVDDIFSTHRLACIFGQDQLYNFMVTSQTENVLTRIYSKTKLTADMVNQRRVLDGDRCLIGHDIQKITEILRMENTFIVGEGKMANLVLAISFLLENTFKSIWISDKKVYEYPEVSET